MNDWPDPDPTDVARTTPIPIRPVGRRVTPLPWLMIPAAVTLTWLLLGTVGGAADGSTPGRSETGQLDERSAEGGAPSGSDEPGDGGPNAPGASAPTTTLLPSEPDRGTAIVPTNPTLPRASTATTVPPTTTTTTTTTTTVPAPAPELLSCQVPEDLNITFDPDSWALDAADLAELERVVASIPAGASVRIDGYTDERPTSIGNDELSRRRADEVRTALIDAGLTGEVEARGNGATNPVDTGRGESAWAKNRRTTITATC